jgi:hypothetical protein
MGGSLRVVMAKIEPRMNANGREFLFHSITMAARDNIRCRSKVLKNFGAKRQSFSSTFWPFEIIPRGR